MKKKIILLFLLIAGVSNPLCRAQVDPGFDEPGSNNGMPTEICTITSEPCFVGQT